MRSTSVVLLASALAMSAPVAAQDVGAIDYNGFVELTAELAEFRQGRLLAKEDFFDQVAEEGALLLDTRSAAAFQMGHLDGAVNLPFSDFTDEKLREVIGEDKARAIYIYCNNNFSNDVAPVALKRAPLALNIPTFVNLFGYGYTNIWELDGTMPLAEVDWVSNLETSEVQVNET